MLYLYIYIYINILQSITSRARAIRRIVFTYFIDVSTENKYIAGAERAKGVGVHFIFASRLSFDVYRLLFPFVYGDFYLYIYIWSRCVCRHMDICGYFGGSNVKLINSNISIT